MDIFMMKMEYLVKKIDFMVELRARGDNEPKPFGEISKAVFHKGKVFGEVKVDIAIPCATQNELNEEGC
jgi:glutamate dehydrogenase (NADP+)